MRLIRELVPLANLQPFLGLERRLDSDYPRFMERPFPAYQGDAAYIFVSYAHDDADQVFPELIRLREQGFNVWYDEGIQAGSSWREEIATAINDCAVFLMFVTPRSVISEPCKREINFAESHHCQMLSVHLEETVLPLGLDLVLGDRQAILRCQYSNADFQQKLFDTTTRLLEGGEADTSVPVASQGRGRKPLVLASVGLSVIFAGSLLWQWLSGEALPGFSAEPSSISADAGLGEPRGSGILVIPFTDLSPNNENDYFAAGMYEDVLHRISGSLGLPVIARNTAMKFTQTDKTPREIGLDIGVSHILTGSVRRAGDQVRINVQLVGTDRELQIWSESYDRQLDDIFAIQSDVAMQIANAMKVNLDDANTTRLKARPTENLEAYDLYIRGRELARPGTTAGIAEATTLFRQAVNLAPEFAQAHAHLAIALANNRGDWDRVGTFRAAELALSLNPGESEAQFAMASVLVRDNRIEESFPYYEQAVALNPNSSEIRMAYGKAHESIFDIRSAGEQWEKNLYLDPLSVETNMQIGHTRERQIYAKAMQGLEHDYALATEYFRRAVTIEPDNLAALRELMLHLWRVGQQVESVSIALQIHQIDPNDVVAINLIVQTFIDNGQGQPARSWIARLPSNLLHQRNALSAQVLRREGSFADAVAFTKEWFENHPENVIAKIQYVFSLTELSGKDSMHTDDGEATRLRRLARRLLHDIVTDEAGQYYVIADVPAMGQMLMEEWWVMSVELILADSLGDREGAEQLARLIIERYEAQPFRRTGNSLHAALAYAILGERDTAIEKVEELERLGVAFYARYVLANWFEENRHTSMDLSSDVTYQLAVQKMEQRNALLKTQISEALPELGR